MDFPQALAGGCVRAWSRGNQQAAGIILFQRPGLAGLGADQNGLNLVWGQHLPAVGKSGLRRNGVAAQVLETVGGPLSGPVAVGLQDMNEHVLTGPDVSHLRGERVWRGVMSTVTRQRI